MQGLCSRQYYQCKKTYMKKNRRDFIKKATALAALSAVGVSTVKGGLPLTDETDKNENVNQTRQQKTQKKVEWPVTEGPGLPKLCMVMSAGATAEEMQQMKQLGINWVHMGGGQIPWKTDKLLETVNRFKAEGLSIINMMIGGFPNSIYGREGRDAEIAKVKESLAAAGAAGIPVVEYNFYVDRLMDGYYLVPGRGGAGMTGFKAPADPPARPDIGTYTAEQLWDNLTYFLKAVIPAAEKAGVRMALHPNDPPVPVSHGSAQIIASYKDWKHLLDLVDSPSNGMTYDCGVSREMGEDPLEVLKYIGGRNRVNHIHFRNVTVEEPYRKYAEVFYDEGQVNMFAIMQEILRMGYKFGINPEHPRLLTYDKEHPRGITTWRQYPGGGGYAGEAYDVGYARAMMQAVQSL
jgi:mannonate dehydratase